MQASEVVEQRLGFERERYISRWSTHAYKMEYRGFFANHLLHALVALSELGASAEQIESYLERFVDHHCVETRPRIHVNDMAGVMRWSEAHELVGRRRDFEGLRAMYEVEVQRLTPDGAVGHYLPLLVDGLAGSLLHAIIQLGYGYRIGGNLPVAEGLAYLHYSSVTFGVDDEDDAEACGATLLTRSEALKLVKSIQDDELMMEELNAHMRTPAILDFNQGSLQPQILCFSSDKERGNPVLFAAIKKVVDRFDFRAVDRVLAVDFALWLYNIVGTNDFVLLHAATSAWALGQVEHLLTPRDRVRAWRVWFRAALSAFVTHEVPPLAAQDPTDQAETAVKTLPAWSEIVTETIAQDGDVDEHVYKLVQVASTHVASSPRESSLLTPTERDFVARSASLQVTSKPFGGRKGKFHQRPEVELLTSTCSHQTH